jgi:3-hydroxyisobutyrate dehydrogenase-like beta-hydroxyacid dehydrogenase
MQVAFIGLGAMGFPMAGHLVGAGFDTVVFNRTTRTGERWRELHGGVVAPTPADAAEGSDVVCVCVGADADVRQVLLGHQGALGALRPGAVIVDHTTASAELAREIGAACTEVGVGFLDAPVSGGQAGAESGRLSTMVGGEPAVLETVRPVLDAYAARITLVGPIGAGQLTKMVNQILVAAAIGGAAEALNFAEAAGLDTAKVFAAVTGGAANSWYLENRAETMLSDEFDFGFAVDWIHKDLGIVLDEADRHGVPVPFTTLAEADYERARQRGEGRLDATVVIRQRRDETARRT